MVTDAPQKHGLREIPGSDPEGRTGVTLKCTRAQEAACYRDNVGNERAYNFLSTLCDRPDTEVHIVWGAVDDFMYANLYASRSPVAQCSLGVERSKTTLRKLLES